MVGLNLLTCKGFIYEWYGEKRNANPVISKPEITCFMNNLDFWGEKKPKKQENKPKQRRNNFLL